MKLHSLYIYSLVRLTPYACSPAIDGSVLTVAVRECIIVFGSVSALRPILGVDAPSLLCCFLGAEFPNLPRMCADSGGFPSFCAKSRKNS